VKERDKATLCVEVLLRRSFMRRRTNQEDGGVCVVMCKKLCVIFARKKQDFRCALWRARS